MPTILNGANEACVELFLEKKIKFLDIADTIEKCMEVFEDKSNEEMTIENIIKLDKEVKEYVMRSDI